jgi:hypothetical protein
MTDIVGKLGKGKYVHDERTVMLARLLLPEIPVPATWDFDKGRKAIPLRMWGNDAWGDCVIAGEANQLLRLERIEQRRTVPMGDQDAINRYKELTGAQQPEDENDTGLVVLEAMRNWRNTGWQMDGRVNVRNPRNYSIAAYGELEPNDHSQLRAASYLLHGIHFGFALPIAAQGMTNNGVWDYNGETGSQWEPGSWGGHLVYSKAFDPESMEILTWAMKVKVTNNFIDKYCDEAWAVVDSLDSWRTKQTIDVQKLIQTLTGISHKVDE